MGTAIFAVLALGAPVHALTGKRPTRRALPVTRQAPSGINESSSVSAVAAGSVAQASAKLRQPDRGFEERLYPDTADVHRPTPDNYNNIFYRNKTEFTFDTGVLPINIPFPFDFLLGGGYNKTPLQYTLVPMIGSVRWQFSDVDGPSFLRGTWDAMFGGSFTAIPRGPETRFWAYMMGIRRNFVQPNWRVAPYMEGRVGIGNIDAKEPDGVLFAQGQDLTFTLLIGSGLRYSLNSRYGISAGVTYMHISNLYLSEPKYPNYGINVYGPSIGFDVRLGKAPQSSY